MGRPRSGPPNLHSKNEVVAQSVRTFIVYGEQCSSGEVLVLLEHAPESSEQGPQHPDRVAVYQVQKYERRALRVAVAPLLILQRYHRHAKTRCKLRLGEAQAAP